MRALRTLLFVGGALGSLILLCYQGAGPIASAFRHVTCWQFAILCVVYGATMAVDAIAWQYALGQDRAPFHKLLAARCASEASNALTVLASVGGEAIKAWLVQLEIPYEESIPSLILSKSAEVIGQTLLLAVGAVVALRTEVVGSLLPRAMSYLLLMQVVAVGGFVAVQLTGMVATAGRMLSWAGIDQHARQLDSALRGFYRNHWRRFLCATALHFGGTLIAVVEAIIILRSLQLAPSLALATIIEALWSGVRFATFFIPGSLGPLEGATSAAFPTLGLAASAGLAFTLVRRARQLAWIGLGLVILVAMRPRHDLPGKRVQPASSSAASGGSVTRKPLVAAGRASKHRPRPGPAGAPSPSPEPPRQ